MADELKPCPFCGGEARTVEGNELIGVVCTRCKAAMGHSIIWLAPDEDPGPCDGDEKCIEAWNTRHVETCEVEYRDSAWGGYTKHCGNCGADLGCDTRNKQNYCPNCGRRVTA